MPSYKKAIFAVIFANLIWGAASPIFKWSLTTIHPFTLAFFRFFLPALVLFFLSPKQFSIKSKDIPFFIFSGLMGIGLNIGAFFIGISQTESINSPVISSSAPVFVLLGSIFFLREQPSKKMLMGNLLGLTGVLFIVFEPILLKSHVGSLAGNLFLMLATIGGIIGTLLNKKLSKTYSPLTITFWTFSIGSATFLLPFLHEIHTYGLINQLQTPGIFGIIFGSIFSSFLAYTLYYWALKKLPASKTTVYTYMDPVVAMAIAAPLVHEYPTPFFISGALLIILGMYIAEGNILHYHPLHLLFKKRLAF